MPIEVNLYITEMGYVTKGLERAIEMGKQGGQQDKVVSQLTEVIISAGRVLQKDQGVGWMLRLDKTILVAKGYQIKAYLEKLEGEPENADKIMERMGKIARGGISFDNPYFAEIMRAMDEWEETSDRGDFYTRPRSVGQ
ncbi:hypothetical protein HYU13_01460 [Candidatus Woesearchaeota archaeon]|nr:hypothetical protein [Candidatus Woesearchaeota archaeon]